MRTAILVDGGYYRKRAFSALGDLTPKQRADELYSYCKRHLTEKKNASVKFEHELYRIFYYDCPPSAKKVYHPLIKRTVDLGKSDLYTWTKEFFEELINKTIAVDDLKDSDFFLSIDQKGVDMKIGLDIASLSYKKQVDQIVLIAGDSDFVPASKLARREGIDFILDPLGANIKGDLSLHIDGLRTCAKAYLPVEKS